MTLPISMAQKRRNALFALFFLPGIGIASWVTRTPDVRDAVGASTAQMGLILFGLSAGSMAGILLSGPAVARVGTRKVVLAGSLFVTLGVLMIGLGAAAHCGPLVALGLAFFGFGMGSGEVALNVEGGDVEQILQRSVMPLMHGFFSLGTLIGALLGMLFTAIEFPVAAHLGLVAGVTVLILVSSIRSISADTGRRSIGGSQETRVASAPVWKDLRLLLIGGIILALAMAEGTANDWLPLVMVDGHGFDATFGSAAYAIFAASMVIGRFCGGWFVDRIGRAAVLGGSAALGAIGIAIVIYADHHVVVIAALVLWGIGASLGFPVALSAAADSGPNSAARISFAATLGYIAFLVGPPVLGFVGEDVGLRSALNIVMVLVVVSIFISPAARTRTGLMR